MRLKFFVQNAHGPGMQDKSVAPRDILILAVIINAYPGIKHSGFTIDATLDQNCLHFFALNACLELPHPGSTKSIIVHPNFFH